MIRGRIKKPVERLLSSDRVAPLLKHRTRGKDLILAYHGVIPPGESAAGSASLHIPSAQFFEQVAAAGSIHRIVPLGELLASPADDVRVAITFDDAYSGVVSHVLPELAASGVPATVFVAPAFVDGPSFWWDAMSAPGVDLPTEVRDHALWRLGGEQARIRDWALREGMAWTEAPEHARCSELAGLRYAAGLPGIVLAGHTWSHPNLAAIPEERVLEELTTGRRWLQEQIRGAGDILAYPYGFENAAARRVAAGCGYSAALKIEGGWVDASARRCPFLLPRMNVPAGLSTRGFVVRMRGLFGDG